MTRLRQCEARFRSLKLQLGRFQSGKINFFGNLTSRNLALECQSLRMTCNKCRLAGQAAAATASFVAATAVTHCHAACESWSAEMVELPSERASVSSSPFPRPRPPKKMEERQGGRARTGKVRAATYEEASAPEINQATLSLECRSQVKVKCSVYLRVNPACLSAPKCR